MLHLAAGLKKTVIWVYSRRASVLKCWQLWPGFSFPKLYRGTRHQRGVWRITLTFIVVLGVFAISVITIVADPGILIQSNFPVVQTEPTATPTVDPADIPTELIPPIDLPGPRVAFAFTRMPKLAYVEGEEFTLKFTTIPITGSLQIWNQDISVWMTLGTPAEDSDSLSLSQRTMLSTALLNHGIIPDFSNPSATLHETWHDLSESKLSELIADLQQFEFRYEPWSSTLDMLQSLWTEGGLCDGMLNLVSGSGGARLIHRPCLSSRVSVETLHEHGPAGWYEFIQGVIESIDLARGYALQGYPVEVFVVNRGPVLDADRDRIPELIEMATAANIRVNVVPMGNEPGPRTRFPYLKPLRELAEATGGSVYYQPNLEDPFDFSMLPRMVPQMIQDHYDRIDQIGLGTEVAPHASLVLVPSEHVEIVSPEATEVTTGTLGIRVDFQGLTIGERQDVEIRLRVSTGVTETLLPVFRGSTQWTDPQYSYFEWYDQEGLSHRLPLPQRVISVTNTNGIGATPTPTPTWESEVTPTASPSPVLSLTPTANPTTVASPTLSLTPAATPTSAQMPTYVYYMSLIARGGESGKEFGK